MFVFRIQLLQEPSLTITQVKKIISQKDNRLYGLLTYTLLRMEEKHTLIFYAETQEAESG